MFSAAELIEAVQRKLRLTHRRSHPPGEFPPGWSRWFDAMHAERGAINGAPAAAIVEVLLARAPAVRTPGPLSDLSRWQAFASVWRQDWSNEPPGDRGWRLLSALLSLLINATLGLMFLWLLFVPARPDAPATEGEELVVQVEYIGDGTPDESGGGPEEPLAEPVADPVPAPTPDPLVEQAPAPSSLTRPVPPQEEVAPPEPFAAPRPEIDLASTAPTLSAPETAVVEREVPTPQPPTPVVEQRVMVSEPAPDTTDAIFLPPPTPAIAVSAISEPELASEAPSVRRREVPMPEAAPTPPALDIPTSDLETVPELAGEVSTPQPRDIPEPLRRPDLKAREAPSIEAPLLESSAPTAVRERAVPLPAAPASTPETAAPTASAVSEAAARPQAEATAPASSSSSAPGAEARASSNEAAPAAAASGGPRLDPAPGGWPTPKRADDFGVSDRNVPGAQRGNDGPGLFDADGSVRLGDSPGTQSPGQPPGTHTEEVTHLDRNGTWLKRPPVGYEPTLFERYWRPNESLLQEWVRRGIKTVSIPIPGTNKKVECAVSLLALGGGCGISDPNLNEQPAEARPPPDIPFKPELQDDNGSIRPGGG